jgi:hypothetical protein
VLTKLRLLRGVHTYKRLKCTPVSGSLGPKTFDNGTSSVNSPCLSRTLNLLSGSPQVTEVTRLGWDVGVKSLVIQALVYIPVAYSICLIGQIDVES